MAKINFHNACPILKVKNLEKSIDYYTEVLGFKLDWKYYDFIASVSRMKSTIFLAKNDQGSGRAWIYIGVSDSTGLYKEFKNRGAKIRQKPTNFSWACEIQIEDLDGNVLRFASEPKKGISFGPWLDMNGKKWKVSKSN